MTLPTNVWYLDYCIKEKNETFGEEYFSTKNKGSLYRVLAISSDLSLVFIPFKNLANTLIPYLISRENFVNMASRKFAEFKERRIEVINKSYSNPKKLSISPRFPIFKIQPVCTNN